VTLDLSIKELAPPKLQFGGALSVSDPKVGLAKAGPFDLHFGSAARKQKLGVGIIGPQDMIDLTRIWISRCMEPIPVIEGENLLKRAFPGFEETFHSGLTVEDSWTVRLDEDKANKLRAALAEDDPFRRFEQVLSAYADALDRLAARDVNRPDIVILTIRSRGRGSANRRGFSQARSTARFEGARSEC